MLTGHCRAMGLLSGEQQGDLQERFADHNRDVYCLSTIIPAFVHQYAFDALLPAVEMYQAFIDDSHDKLQAEFELWKQLCHAAAEPSKTALDAYTACNASLYPNLSILLLTRHHCNGTAFLFHSQTAKDISSVANGRRAADIIGADPRTCTNDANRTCRSRWQVRFDWTTQVNFLR